MYPEIDIGPLTLQSFGLLFVLAFCAAGALVARRLHELGEPLDWAYEMGFAALIGGVLGSRLYSVAQNYDGGEGDVVGGLLAGGGLVWYGGLVGGAAGVLLWAWWRRYLRLGLLDLAAPALALGYAVGRIGCQLSGDGDYGRPWDGPWAMAYPDGTVPTDVPVHPTPVYETLAMGIVAWILWRLRDRVRPGVLFALYLIMAGTERFLVEFVRRNEEVAMGLTAAQFESLAILIAGLVWVCVVKRRHGSLTRDTVPAGRVPRPTG